MQHITKSKPGAHWKQEEIAVLYELAAEGLTATAIAYQIRARFGRSVWATERKLKDLGGLEAVRGKRVFCTRSLNQTARLFGVDAKTVSRWIARGWLEAARYRRRRRTERRGGPVLMISDAAVQEFLAREEAWPSYDPARITDSIWRAEAYERRVAAGGGWEKATDVMRSLSYHPAVTCRMLAAYPGPKRTTMWQAAVYLWAPHVPGFVAWVLDPARDRRFKRAA